MSETVYVVGEGDSSFDVIGVFRTPIAGTVKVALKQGSKEIIRGVFKSWDEARAIVDENVRERYCNRYLIQDCIFNWEVIR